MAQENTAQTQDHSAGISRRFAAMLYDVFLLFALFWLFSIPVILLHGDIVVSSIFYQFYLLTIWFLFYAWFWIHGGQTLGMKAWKIYVCHTNGQAINWLQACIRFFTALLGIANLSIFLNKDKLAWHERLSNTRTYKKTGT